MTLRMRSARARTLSRVNSRRDWLGYVASSTMTDDGTDSTADANEPAVRAPSRGDDIALRRWWLSQTRQGERDIRTRRSRGAVSRAPVVARTKPAVLGIAALITGVVLVGLITRPLAGPAASSSPSLVASGTPVQASDRSAVFGVDGIPTMIAGEPVLRVPELIKANQRDPGLFLGGGGEEGDEIAWCGFFPLPFSSTPPSDAGRCPGGSGFADEPETPGHPPASSLLLAGSGAPANTGALVV